MKKLVGSLLALALAVACAPVDDSEDVSVDVSALEVSEQQVQGPSCEITLYKPARAGKSRVVAVAEAYCSEKKDGLLPVTLQQKEGRDEWRDVDTGDDEGEIEDGETSFRAEARTTCKKGEKTVCAVARLDVNGEQNDDRLVSREISIACRK